MKTAAWLLPIIICLLTVSRLSAEVITPEVRPSLPPAIQAVVDSFAGELYFVGENLKTGKLIRYRSGDRVQTASVIKVPVMAAVFRKHRLGELALEERFPVDEKNLAPGAGVLQHLDPGLMITLQDAVTLMIVYSDNTATNIVIDQVGISRVNELLGELGLHETFLNKKVYRPAPENLPEDRAPFGLGVTTPEEMRRFFKLLYKEQLIDPAASRRMLEILRLQDDDTKIARYLQSAETSVANKTGALTRVRNDVGIVSTPEGDYILSLFAQELRDTRWAIDNAGNVVLANLARELIAELTAP